jgi:surface protein
MFQNSSFNHNIGHWDVANVTNMAQMFRNTPFNQAIGDWNVSNVTRMHLMFKQASSFNQDIGDWEVVNVTNMREMFMQATSFNQDIGSWDVSSVTNMNKMFNAASIFNQDLSNWCVTQIGSEPNAFSTGSPLTNPHKPDWGNCNVPMGVDENTLKLIVQDAEVYPNPFVSTQHRKLSITWEGELNIEELKLVDLYGREMRIDGIQIMHDTASFQMPIQLSEGVYLLQITSHGHVFNKRIAVKH